LSFTDLLAGIVATAVLAAFPSGRAGVAAVSNPPARPAVADARLLAVSAPSDLISPVGVESVLCALAPVMTSPARAEVDAALGIACGTFQDYSPVSVWLEQGPAYRKDATDALQRHAEVFVRPVPLNADIAAWVAQRGGLRVHVSEPLRFAAVSALVYSAAWQFPVNRRLSKPGKFHGRDRETTVTFMTGTGARVVRDGSCERTSIPLSDGGELRLAIIGAGLTNAAVQCIARDDMLGRATVVRYTMPRLLRQGQNDLTTRLKRLGITDLFSTKKEPFSRLERGLKLDEVLQATELRVDEEGVGVRATTIADTILGAPHTTGMVVFDRPFALEVVDKHHAPLAIGVMHDL
jgi:hypothetical protein